MVDFGSLRTITLDANFSVHGVPATVTPCNEPAVETRVIWVVPQTEPMPDGSEFSRYEPVRVASLKKSDVPKVPIGTRIVAPEQGGGEDVAWVVEGIERIEADHHRVMVVRDPHSDA